MVEVRDLTKNYGKVSAVKGISFTAEKGEVLGFLGPNGAGKTTTMNIITGYLSATSGSVRVEGYDILENPKEARASIGYLPELPPLYQDMTVEKYLKFIYELKKVKLQRDEHLLEVMKQVKIDHIKDRVIRNLSKGYRQRVGLAQALVGNPPVLILDEPTVGLDPRQIIEMRNLIKSLGKKHTVIFSSHVLSEVSAVCDRIVVLSAGELVADSKTEEISKSSDNTQSLSVSIVGSPSLVLQTLSSLDGVLKVRRDGQPGTETYRYTVECKEGRDIRASLFRAMAKIDAPVVELKQKGMSLEDIFLQLTEPSAEAKDKGGKA